MGVHSCKITQLVNVYNYLSGRDEKMEVFVLNNDYERNMRTNKKMTKKKRREIGNVHFKISTL